MSTIDHDLARVRADLRAAVQRDILRRRRRRRIARLGIVPAVVLTTAGAAFALAPQLGDPAPQSLTARLSRDLARMWEQVGPAATDHINGPDGKRLTLAAIGESTLLYGAVEPSRAWCAVESTTAGLPLGWSCQEASKGGRPDEVFFISGGGGGTRAANYVSGHVGEPSARTVHLHVAGQGDPIVTPVQRLGFFIAQLPDSTLRSRHFVPISAEALDDDGKVVAKSVEHSGG